jgi:hypothetical protein
MKPVAVCGSQQARRGISQINGTSPQSVKHGISYMMGRIRGRHSVPEPTSKNRPGGISALGIFFAVGAVISCTSAVALLFPGSFLEPLWRLNPRAREAFGGMGTWAVVLMLTVSLACAFASRGLWHARRWGYRLAVGILVVNLIGDVTNVILGTEPRAAVGVPIVAAILWFLRSERVRSFFRTGRA